MLVARGSCTFVDKARNAFNAGAAAVIVTNNQGGMLHMPMGNQDALNITIPVVMVNNATGEKLESTLADGVQLSASVVGAVRCVVTMCITASSVLLHHLFLTLWGFISTHNAVRTQ